MPPISEMTLHAAPLGCRYRRPCDHEKAGVTVRRDRRVSAMSEQARLDVSLPDSDDARRVAAVPDHVDAAGINVRDVEGLETQPLVLCALCPIQTQHFSFSKT